MHSRLLLVVDVYLLSFFRWNYRDLRGGLLGGPLQRLLQFLLDALCELVDCCLEGGFSSSYQFPNCGDGLYSDLLQ